MNKKRYFFLCRYKFLICMIFLLIFLREGMIVFDMWSFAEQGIGAQWGDLPESALSGNLAFDIIDGNWRGWDCYTWAKWGNVGNEVLVSLIAVPLYFLFGNSFFVLAHVPIIFSLGILLLIYYIADTWLSREIANIAAAFFVCAPLNMQARLVYPYCSHFEVSFFALLGLVIFFHIRHGKSKGTVCILAALLGLTSGIGMFHSELYVLPLFFILVYWFIHKRSFFFSAEFGVFLIFFGIGLIPYLLVEPYALPTFIRLLFSGHFSAAITPEKSLLDSVGASLKLMRILFSPFNAAIFSPIPALFIVLPSMVLLGVFGLTVLYTDREKRYYYIYFYLYSFSYIGITLGVRNFIEYYLYFIFPAMTVLCAAGLSEVKKRYLSVHRLLTSMFYCFLVLCCVSNVHAISKHFDPRAIKQGIEKQLQRGGYCFYYSGYMPPKGFKTHYTLTVEAMARQAHYHRGHSDYDKNIFMAPDNPAGLYFDDAKSYMLYGIDVSFEGLEKLAEEIRDTVSVAAQPYAYMGLAVFYVNDNFLSDLLKDFHSGVIEQYIPLRFQKYFYIELARKVLHIYRTNDDTVTEIFALFPEEQRTLMEGAQELIIADTESEF